MEWVRPPPAPPAATVISDPIPPPSGPEAVSGHGFKLRLGRDPAGDRPRQAPPQHRAELGNLPAAEVPAAEVVDAEVLHVEPAAAVTQREVADGAVAGALEVQDGTRLVVGHVPLLEAAALASEARVQEHLKWRVQLEDIELVADFERLEAGHQRMFRRGDLHGVGRD